MGKTDALKAVSKNGRLLGGIPERLKDKDVCMAAVKQNSWALLDVPEELRSKELCELAIKDGWAGCLFSCIPKEHHTPDLCMKAVKVNAWTLECIPEELRSPELCLEAVKRDRAVARFVPAEVIFDALQPIRVRCIEMPNDPRPVPAGMEGSVRYIDDAGHIHVSWDNGQGLSLIPGTDVFTLVLDKKSKEVR